MNKLAVLLCGLVGCSLVLLAAAGPVPEADRPNLARAFRDSSNFFANEIQKNQEAEKAAKNVRSAIQEKRAKFQDMIDNNKNLPIPKPTNPEAQVYLHDGEEEESHGVIIATKEEDSAKLAEQEQLGQRMAR